MVDIRCTCSTQPLLAVGGRDAKGEPFVHVRAHKQRKLIAEVVVTAGSASIHCRSCGRWHRITIRRGALDVAEKPLPEEISLQ